jgi:hypothetical protein
MPLPDLPTQHNSQETDFSLVFRKWWNKHPIRGNIELKHSRGKDSIPFKAIEAEQVAVALAAGSKNGVLLRVASGTVGAGDYIGLVRDPAWVVIKYPKGAYMISIDSFLNERDTSNRKSLTDIRAKEIATYSL